MYKMIGKGEKEFNIIFLDQYWCKKYCDICEEFCV